MTIVPQRDRLVVRRDERQTQTKGGIILPDSAKDTTDRPQLGTVVAVGPGEWHYSPYHMRGEYDKLPFAVGDRIYWTKYAGEGIKVGDEEVFLLKAEDIIAVIEQDDIPADGLPPRHSYETHGPILPRDYREKNPGSLISPSVSHWDGE